MPPPASRRSDTQTRLRAEVNRRAMIMGATESKPTLHRSDGSRHLTNTWTLIHSPSGEAWGVPEILRSTQLGAVANPRVFVEALMQAITKTSMSSHSFLTVGDAAVATALRFADEEALTLAFFELPLIGHRFVIEMSGGCARVWQTAPLCKLRRGGDDSIQGASAAESVEHIGYTALEWATPTPKEGWTPARVAAHARWGGGKVLPRTELQALLALLLQLKARALTLADSMTEAILMPPTLGAEEAAWSAKRATQLDARIAVVETAAAETAAAAASDTVAQSAVLPPLPPASELLASPIGTRVASFLDAEMIGRVSLDMQRGILMSNSAHASDGGEPYAVSLGSHFAPFAEAYTALTGEVPMVSTLLQLQHYRQALYKGAHVDPKVAAYAVRILHLR